MASEVVRAVVKPKVREKLAQRWEQKPCKTFPIRGEET